MPYSSEFALAGPMAKKFAAWCGDAWWANKDTVVERYTGSTGLSTFGLYETDELIVTPQTGYEFIKRSPEPPKLEDIAEKLYSPTPNTRDRYPQVRDPAEIEALVERAASHMFAEMEQFQIATDWILCLAPEDPGWSPIYVDFRGRRWSRQKPEGKSMLTCICETNYLAGLLRGECHWNNAMISFNLKWMRVPNVFDRALFDALNFFHVPRTAKPSTSPARKASA